MIFASLIAASFTFTATATGVAKGTPVEFMFAGKDSDRDYETMFLIDSPVDEFCSALEKSGIPRGEAQDTKECRLWPVGCPLTLTPSIDDFLVREPLPGCPTNAAIIYTGGARDAAGKPVAANTMPQSVFSLYTLDQSPLLFDGIFPQGDVYGHNLAKETLEKGRRYSFTLTWDDKSRPSHMTVVFRPGSLSASLKSVKAASDNGPLAIKAVFSPNLTLVEAKAVANALSQIDSEQIKVNGREADGFFFRAFLPAVKWLDRKERLAQPFELHLANGKPKLLFIEEDWSGDGIDPRLAEREIEFDDAKNHPKTDTCFIYASSASRVADLLPYIGKLPKTVVNWYIYSE